MGRSFDTTTPLSTFHDESLSELKEVLNISDRTCDGHSKRAIRKKSTMGVTTRTALLSILAAVPTAMAQSCISLAGSTQCPAFNTSSISTTDSALVGYLYVPRPATLPELD